MMNKSKFVTYLGLSFTAIGFMLMCGSLTEAGAQTRDPFSKPGWARTRDPRAGGTGTGKKVPGPAVNLGVPGIEQRIEFYKRQREVAAANGQVLPKVTSVLTLSEMSVTGIFRTPRGYAAMIEATPIKLSYTIYPGDKFFDGQLVAVEENRLVFRRVTKMSNGKFVASVENKPLRQYTQQELIQGTAPTGSETKGYDGAAQQAQAEGSQAKPPVAAQIISPVDEMNRQKPDDPEKEKPKKNVKKTAKVNKKDN